MHTLANYSKIMLYKRKREDVKSKQRKIQTSYSMIDAKTMEGLYVQSGGKM